MKKVLLFVSCLSVGFIIACGGGGIRDSSVNPITENVLPINLYKYNVWNSGLIDHEIRNTQVAPTPVMQVSFKDVEAIQFGTPSTSTVPQYTATGEHYKIVNSNTSLLIKMINEHYANIDGIFLGLASPGIIKSGSPLKKEQMFISFVKLDSVRTVLNPNCAVDKMTFYKPKTSTINFKCIDKNNAIWELMPESDPIIVNFKLNKKGVFIGKENLFKNIFRKSNVMYLYTGIYLNERHFVAVDFPYFSPLDNTFSDNPVSSGKDPFYLSTLKSLPAPICANYSYNAHGTARVCPNNCPQ
jgi:hypothetical protein